MKRMMLALCALLCAVMLTGCSGQSEAFEAASYAEDGANVSEIRIDVRDRQITVSPSEDDQVYIGYFQSAKEGYDIALSGDGVLCVTAEIDKEWTDFFGKKAPVSSRTIDLRVPDALLDTLSIATTNGEISVGALTVNANLSLTSNGGDIRLDSVSAGNEIRLDVKNGSIDGTIAGSYDDYAISCSVKKGDSNLPSEKETGSRRLTVAANNGNVRLDIR